MDKVRQLIRNKPGIYVYLTLGYLLGIIVWKWVFHPSLDALWFFIGGAIGVYFLDGAELFFALSPSPFRSIVFQSLFAVVAFFAVTSSTSVMGSGLVLSLYLQILLWQIGEWNMTGNLHSWYRMIAGPVSVATERVIFIISVILFLAESVIFAR